MDAGHYTSGRIGWWFERGSLVLSMTLAATLYVFVVASAELGLPQDVQLAIFESQRGILWVDGQSILEPPSLQAAVPVRQHLP